MTVVFDQTSALTGTDDGNGNSNVNFRQVINSALLSTASGNQVRVTVRFGTAEGSETPAVDNMWISQAAASGNAYNFDGNQVQVTFSGGSSINGSVAGVLVSDWVTLGAAYDSTKNYVLAFHCHSGAAFNSSNATLTNANLFFDPGASNSATTSVTLTQFVGSDLFFIEKIEIQASGGGTAVTTDFGCGFEFVGSVHRDGSVLLESLSSVRADRPLQLEAISAVRRDNAALAEINAGLSASAAAGLEFLGSARADLTGSLETTGALRSDAAVLTELTAGVRSDASAAIEALSGQRIDQAAALENLGAVQVIGSAAAQLEMLSSFRADQSAALESSSSVRSDLTVSDEALAGVLRSAGSGTETLAGVQSSAAVEVENLGAVAVVGNASVQFEAVGTVSSSQALGAETTAAVRSDATGTAEALVSVSRHTGAAVENVAGVRSDAAPAQENSGALAVIASAGAPIEILASTRTDAGGSVETVAKMQASTTTGPLETTAALTSNLPAPLENTFGVKRDSAIQDEVQGGVSVVSGSAVQIEITSRFATFSAAAIEIVQIAVSAVLRMLSATGVFTGETDLPPGQPQPFDPSVSPGYVDTPNETYRPINTKGVSNG